MSHFVVVVVGEEIEEQLENFNENREIDKYVVSDDQEQILKEVEEAFEYYKDEKDSIDRRKVMDLYLSKNSYDPLLAKRYILNEYQGYDTYEIQDGKLIEMSTSNPEGHWDWWAIGGRWSGYFDVKTGSEAGLPHPHYDAIAEEDDMGYSFYVSGSKDLGEKTLSFQEWAAQSTRHKYHTTADFEAANVGKSDTPLVKDIDFEWGKKRVTVKANELFDKYEKLTEGLTPKSWKETCERWGPKNLNDARNEYHDNAWVKAIRPLTWNPEIFLVGREAYIEEEVRDLYVPYAIVHEGEWIAKGQMGWFGMSSDVESDDDWAEYVQKFYASLPSDTRLTATDCHV